MTVHRSGRAVALRSRAAYPPIRRAAAAALPQPRPAARAKALRPGLPIDGLIVTLACLAVVLMTTIPSTLLTRLHVHYVTTGGAAYEKFHPAAYVLVLAFCLTVMRDGAPVRDVDRMISQAKLVLPYCFAIIVVLVQSIVLHHPVTSGIDTFVIPLVAFLLLASLSSRQKRPLALALHLLMLTNVALGYFEYLSGHRIVPLDTLTALDNPALAHEWRSTALLGHPLSASALVGAYTLALVFRPCLIPSAALRIPVTLLCLGSLFVFGGRTALVLVMLGVGLLVAWKGMRLARGSRMSLPFLIAGICAIFLVAAGVMALLDAGFLNKMLLRFSSDNGSAWARVASLQLLASLDWRETLLGTDPARLDSLQSAFGIHVGIEDFWIACIAQYGLVATVLLTVGLVCFFLEVLRRSHPAAVALALFLIVIAAGSVSLSSKTMMLTEYVTLILVLLPRDPIARTAPPASAAGMARPAPRRL